MEHRGQPTVVDLGIERGPVVAVSGCGVSVGDIEHNSKVWMPDHMGNNQSTTR